MKKYKILIIGHSDFPSGAKSFLEFFGIPKNCIHTFHLDNENSQNLLRKNLENFYSQNSKVITFADLSGGSPHLTAAEVLSVQGTEDQYLISSISMSVILEVSMLGAVIGTDKKILEEVVFPSINMNLKNITGSKKDKIIKYNFDSRKNTKDMKGGI